MTYENDEDFGRGENVGESRAQDPQAYAHIAKPTLNSIALQLRSERSEREDADKNESRLHDFLQAGSDEDKRYIVKQLMGDADFAATEKELQQLGFNQGLDMVALTQVAEDCAGYVRSNQFMGDCSETDRHLMGMGYARDEIQMGEVKIVGEPQSIRGQPTKGQQR
jgi:hypothetical protein